MPTFLSAFLSANRQIVIGSLFFLRNTFSIKRVLIENALDGLIESFRYRLPTTPPLFTQCRIQIHFTNADLALQNSDYVNYVRVFLVPISCSALIRSATRTRSANSSPTSSKLGSLGAVDKPVIPSLRMV